MVKVAGFESVLSKASVGLNFFRSFVCDCGLVDYCLCLAFSLQWAGIFRAAIAISFCDGVGFFAQNGFIVRRDDALDIRHTTITSFQCVPVEYFV